MRIISGVLKGKSLIFIKNTTTRPLKDSVKENIFNIIKHSNLIDAKIENSFILDLYSGVGSFGLESISRGANYVTFVEQNKTAANLIRENLNKFSISNKATIVNDNIENFLVSSKSRKFKIFFLDPPFSKKLFIKDLHLIKERKIYEKKHIIIIHREKNSCDDFENLINIIFIKNYGRSKIIFGVFK